MGGRGEGDGGPPAGCPAAGAVSPALGEARALAFPLLRDLCSQALGPGRGVEGVLVHRIGPEICCLCRVSGSLEHKGKQKLRLGRRLGCVPQPSSITAQVNLTPGWGRRPGASPAMWPGQKPATLSLLV